MTRLLLCISLTAATILAGCADQPAKSSQFGRVDYLGPDDVQVNGFTFPARLGAFRRVGYGQYNKAETDISISYNSGNSIAATVYVYPNHRHNLAVEFAQRQAEIENVHPGAQRKASGSRSIAPQGISALGASYEYSDYFGGTMMPVRSELLVAAHGDQFVEYRFTWPAFSLSAPDEVSYFEQTFAWP